MVALGSFFKAPPSEPVISGTVEMFTVWVKPQYHTDFYADILEALLVIPMCLLEDAVPAIH